jgi:3-hydroxybutyryl-CoA dehydrogenase
MTIAAVANAAQKLEIGLKTFPSGVEWIWVDSVQELDRYPDADLFFDLDFVMEAGRIGQLSRLLPKPVIINSVLHTLTEIGQPFVRINGWPGLLQRSHSELAVADQEAGSVVGKLFEKLDWPYCIVPDIPGLISARILCMVINEAYYTLQDRVSTKEEIDTAMKLGTNYPFGPFEWSRKIGLSAIYLLLESLSRTDSRFRAAKALEQDL